MLWMICIMTARFKSLWLTQYLRPYESITLHQEVPFENRTGRWYQHTLRVHTSFQHLQKSSIYGSNPSNPDQIPHHSVLRKHPRSRNDNARSNRRNCYTCRAGQHGQDLESLSIPISRCILAVYEVNWLHLEAQKKRTDTACLRVEHATQEQSAKRWLPQVLVYRRARYCFEYAPSIT